MMIQKLALRDFGGVKFFEVNFQKLNVITGRNAEGKTRILRGVKIGLVGYDPSLGKTKTAKLASGNLGVSLLVDGETKSWNWKRTKTGLSAVGEQPQPVEIATTLLDFRTFLNKSGPQQIAFVIEQTDLNAIGFSVNALKAKIKGATPEKPTEQTEIAAQAINGDIQQADAEAEKAGMNAAAWLELLFAKLKERAKLAKQELDRLTGSIQTGVTIASKTNVRNKALIDRDIEETHKEIARIESEKAVILEQQKKYESNADRRKELEKKTIGDPAKVERLAQISIVANRLNSEIAAFKPTTNAKQQIKQAAATKHATAKSKVGQLETLLNNLSEEKEALAVKDACPCCGETGLTCQANQRAAKEIDAKMGVANRELFDAQAAEEMADQELTKAESDYCDAFNAESANQAKQRELNEFNAEISELNSAIAKVATAKGELAALESVAAPSGVDVAIVGLNGCIETLRKKLEDFRSELTAATAAAAARLRRIQEEENQEQARANHEVAKLALDKVAEEKEKLVAKSMNSLLKTARRFTDGIVDGLLSWENDELGIRRGENWISHEVFSGTEAAIAYIGVAVALCQSSKFKLVMMDELGVVDDANLITLLGKMETLIQAGVVDQFIACDVRHERYASFDSEKVNIIKI